MKVVLKLTEADIEEAIVDFARKKGLVGGIGPVKLYYLQSGYTFSVEVEGLLPEKSKEDT